MYSKTNTKRKAIFLGIVFIVIGLVLGVGMVIMWLTQGFFVLYIVFIISSMLPIWAGIATFNSIKYPIVLKFDNMGVHYFVDAGIWGGKRELIFLWKDVRDITYSDNGDDFRDIEEYMALQVEYEDENRESLIIPLWNTVDFPKEVTDILSEINKIREFY